MAAEIMWFRRDLRVHDNEALHAAVGAEATVPLFVLDPHLLNHPRMSASRLVYLRQALADLAASIDQLGGHLVVRRGDPRQVVPSVAGSAAASRVHISADHTPFAVARDDAVAQALRGDGVELHRHGGVAIADPGSVLTDSDSVYKVFTPFHRSWRARDHGSPLPPPERIIAPPDRPEGADLGEVDAMDVSGPEIGWPEGGEVAARERLQTWLEGGVEHYDQRRDLLAVDGTSRLSADLHFGCLSAREVWTRLDRRRSGHKTFAAELAWRDFYLHVMAEWPHAATSAFRPELDGLAWEDDDEAFAAWAEGRTGYPVVDAAMRQLTTSGWMHNRARMIVASFLTKDLLIDWRRGEAHFMAHLVDGDTASNNGGWQWAAGTGTDAQPFFRIFNPVTQGTRYDPDGDYVRRWVPELAGLPMPQLHHPWTMSEQELAAHGVRLGRDYPVPIVDHQRARDRALAWWERRPR